ncbi:MAG TPA: putative Ig domain-containing protein [Streptosporangiaceae bacterium]|nr:putative Ig domain-containing protein [Streptosporangiaceae bacterium]
MATLAAIASVGLSLFAVPSGSAAASSKPKANHVYITGNRVPRARWHHNTDASGKPASGRPDSNGLPGPNDSPNGSGLGQPLPLGSLPLGTVVSNQFEKDGIIFSGQSPFITDDGSSDVNPTLSGTPLFQGTVVGTFVKPGTTKPATVDEFSIDVGFINSPDSTQMTVYNSKHKQLGVLDATQEGFNQLFSTFPGAASFSVSSVADEPAGWEINTIQIGPIQDNYAALGDSYSSGEGTRDFPWSQSKGTQCDTGPLAWPVQMADSQNSSGVNGKLTIGPDTLIACQGEVTADLPNTRAGEADSELDQLFHFFVKHHAPPDLVTMTIGGNDVNFSGILTDCFLGGAEVCLHVSSSLDNMVTNDSSALIFKLAHAYEEVKQSAGGKTQVVIAGYPDLFPTPGGLGRAFSVYLHCPWLRDTLSIISPVSFVSPFTNKLLRTMEHAQESLNSDMAIAALIAGVQFVPIPFVWFGHEMCTSSPWINPINPFEAGIFNNNRNSGHPNVTGSAAIAAAVGSSIGLEGSNSPAGRLAMSVPPPLARDLSTPAAQRAVMAKLGIKPATLRVTSGSLLSGTVGASYVDYLISTGGTGNQTWKITKGKLPPGLKLRASVGTITGTPTKAGKFTFRAQATDVAGKVRKTASASKSITVGKLSTLRIRAVKPQAGTVNQAYSFTFTANGGLGAVTWAVTKGTLPAGLQLNTATGQLSGQPSKAGTFAFTVSATDSSRRHQVARAAESVTIEAASATLEVTTAGLPKITAGQDYDAELTSAGGSGAVQWSISAGTFPAGLSLDQSSGNITGSPTSGGTYHFTVQVTDSATPTPHTATRALTMVVATAPALHIATKSLFNGTEGGFYFSVLAATGGAGQYEWSASGNVPPGLSLDSGSGVLSGTPTGPGKFSFQVTVQDAAGHEATRTYTITIARVKLRVSKAVPPATVGSYYTANVKPSGGEAPYSYSEVSGTLPTGLSFDSVSGAIVGTPAKKGKFTIKVHVTDSSSPPQQVTVTVTVNVAAVPKLTLSRRAPVGGAVGVPYTAGLGFSGGRAPYTWSVSKGKLPPGLVIDKISGMITGTPTRRGKFALTIKVTDSTKPKHEVATAPITITIAKNPPLTISKPALPLATQGISYLATLRATGGIAPYFWTVPSGSLPAGLFLDSEGDISGTPTGKGARSFLVAVTDSGTHPVTVKRRINLTIEPNAPLSVTTTQLDPASQNNFYEETLGAVGGAGPYTWSLSKGKLPAGLFLDSGGVISGEPTGFGTFTFTVKVTDSATPLHNTTKQRLTLNIEPTP